MTGTWRTAALALLVAGPAGLSAQENADAWLRKCREHESRRNARHCETREYTLRSTGNLTVSSSPNGGVAIRVWNRSDVRVIAKIQTHAPSIDEARSIAGELSITASPGEIRTDGPRFRDRRGWAVSYEIWAPAATGATLSTVNGGLSVEGLTGDLRLQTTNGGITLAAVSGAVHARSTNGGIEVEIARGGKVVDLETTNGGIQVMVPDGVGAEINAMTTNGGIDFEFPVQVQGRIRRNLTATIGGGGPTYRVKTTNGGISIRRS